MRRYQSGFVAIALAVVIAIVVSLFLIGFSAEVSRSSGSVLEDVKQQYVSDSAKSLDGWYRRNAWVIDSNIAVIPTATIATQAGVAFKYGAQIVSSKRLDSNGISYHVIAIWLPNTSITGTDFNTNTGVLTEGTYASVEVPRLKYSIIDGKAIQTEIAQQTLNNLGSSAAKLENWFASKAVQAESSLINSNWYRNPSCGSTDQRYIPCIDTYTDAGTTLQNLGIASSIELTSGWAQPIQISNLQNSSTTAPYSISLKADTPWGTSIYKEAVQISTTTL